MTGMVLGGYYLLSHEIGHGANGAVYLAVDLRTHQNRAIKEITGNNHREAELLLQIRHEHIMHAAEIIYEDQREYLVCEYIEGKTLEQIACECIRASRVCSKTVRESRTITEKQVIQWGIELAEAVNYLHRRSTPVIHRDIKPGNIMIDQEQKLHLIDFGIAIHNPVITSKSIGTDLCGQALERAYGSKGFAAPEQYGDGAGRVCRPLDGRADLYAFGKTFVYLCDKQQITAGFGLRRILKKCTRTAPKWRYQSAERLCSALKVLYQVKYPDNRRKKIRAGCFAVVLAAMLIMWGSRTLDRKAFDSLPTGLSPAENETKAAYEAADRMVRASDMPSETEAIRFFEDYEELKQYVQGVLHSDLCNSESREKYDKLLELSCLYAPFREDEAAEEAAGLLEKGLSDLEHCMEIKQYGEMSREECSWLYAEYCRQLFLQYRLMGQQKLQNNRAGALENMIVAAGYGERLRNQDEGTEDEKAALLCDLGRIYAQTESPEEALSCYRQGTEELQEIPTELYLSYLELLTGLVENETSDYRKELQQVYEDVLHQERVTADPRFERIRIQAEQIMEERGN
ncbi:MAG: serine/threonine-protein kinase [bacterium]|nr:serine/threonine-protein kinase [bacterium]